MCSGQTLVRHDGQPAGGAGAHRCFRFGNDLFVPNVDAGSHLDG
jgi:hypothetical protein